MFWHLEIHSNEHDCILRNALCFKCGQRTCQYKKMVMSNMSYLKHVYMIDINSVRKPLTVLCPKWKVITS